MERLEPNRRGGRMAVAGAEHRGFGRAVGGGGRRLGLRARALDAGDTRAAEGHAAPRGARRAALRLGLLFRVSEEFPDAAQSGAVSRVAVDRCAGFSGAPCAGRPLGPRGMLRQAAGLAGGAAMIDLEREIDALMRAYQGAVPGAGVGVLQGGAPVVQRAYGLADADSRIAATTATNYRLASLTN